MIINIIDEQSSLSIHTAQVEQIIKQILEEEHCLCDEVTAHFIDTKTMCDLHEQFFQDPSPTDCISFPMDDEEDPYYRVLGEFFVCPDTAILYAKEHLIDPYEEATLYIVHSMLHLLGYDDIEEVDQQEMRQAEQRHMTLINAKKLTLSSKSI